MGILGSVVEPPTALLIGSIADYLHLGRAVEITEWITHCRSLRNLARRLKPIYSDHAARDAPKVGFDR